jgi:threonine/homoserine/homoserine lactone efflux protein
MSAQFISFQEMLQQIWQPLLMLVLASAAVMGSPGPSTMSATAVGAAFGLRKSLAYASGLILGTTTVLFAVATGLFTLLLSAPKVTPILIAASAAYILYLAWKIASAPPLSDSDAVRSVPKLWEGFLLAVANPKAYVAVAAVFAGTTIVSDGIVDAVVKTAVLAVMIVLIHVCWLLAGASFSRILRDPLSSRIANILFAAALVASVVLPFLR